MVSLYEHRKNLIIIRIKTGRLAFRNVCNCNIRNHTSYTETVFHPRTYSGLLCLFQKMKMSILDDFIKINFASGNHTFSYDHTPKSSSYYRDAGRH